MPSKQSTQVIISKSRSVNKPFKVSLFNGDTQQIIMSRSFGTRRICKKNIVGMISMFSGKCALVVDKTVSPAKATTLFKDGFEEIFTGL